MSMTTEQQALYYNQLIDEHGESAAGGGHGSEENRELRYRRLVDTEIFRNRKTHSLLDVGCGVGWLAQHWPAATYTGIDISETAIAYARNRHPNHKFEVGKISDISGTYDYVLASGLFQFVDTPSATKKIAFLWVKARYYLAFNMLSVKASRKDEGDCYHEPGIVVTSLLPFMDKFEILHNYLDNEFTVRIWK